MDAHIVEMVDQHDANSSFAAFDHSDNPVSAFGLKENPFRDSVNPDYFFRTTAHEDAYLKMKKCISENISMGITTARSGTGKTLLTQILLHELNEGSYRPALILAYPRISRSALLKELAAELEIEGLRSRPSLHDLIGAVQERIYDLHSEGLKPVFIIDEVHFMGGDTLHLLRTLSNIETAEKKLLTILLFGEETFLEKLEKPKYRAILSRAFVRARLRALEQDEVEQYIKFRCLMAGGSGEIFTPETFGTIYEATEGIPREINRLCHNALSVAEEAGQKKITSSIINTAIEKGI